MTKIYLITFTKESSKNAVLPESFEKSMSYIFTETDMDELIMYGSNGSDVMIWNASEYRFDDFKNLLEDYGYLKNYRDITTDVVMDNFITNEIDMLCKKDKNKLNKMKLDVVDINMILDKISIKGMDSLTDVDKAVLKS